jgi:hypothetical protein
MHCIRAEPHDAHAPARRLGARVVAVDVCVITSECVRVPSCVYGQLLM